MHRGLLMVVALSAACAGPGQRNAAPSPQSVETVTVTPARAAAPAPIPTATEELLRLFVELDRDGDGRITARDRAADGAAMRFVLHTASGDLTVEGTGPIAHTAELLAAAVERAPSAAAEVQQQAVLAPRTQVLRTLIDASWEGLVRKSDHLDGLLDGLRSTRAPPADKRLYIYYPSDDPTARDRLKADLVAAPNDLVSLVAVPRRLDAQWLARLDRDRGIMYLPRPYIVPGGRFTEMYGWDSYFMARGAIASGRLDLAIDVLEDLIYQIEHYGKIGNSNRSFHRGRSQPPFLPRLALEVTDAMPAGEARDTLLRRAAAAAELERTEVWLAKPRITPLGLSLYRDEMVGAPPEVPPSRYKVWRDTPEFYAHQRAVRESGWDMTLRFGERGHRIVPVCLNALLFAFERDLAEIHRRVEGPSSAAAARLEKAASVRRTKIDRYFWDKTRGLYFDWDLDRRVRTSYEHVASFYALWAGLASSEQARRVVANLPRFEAPGGLTVSSEASRRAGGEEQQQWDWPYGWAPLQLLAVEGLRRYQYAADADRIATAWLSLLLDVADAHNGTLKEKYDVVARTADVPIDYGNQGNDRGALVEYIADCDRQVKGIECVRPSHAPHPPVGFGWTNASYELLFDGLSPDARQQLDIAR